MKTSVSIPDRIYHAAERAAKREDVTRSRLYSTALDDFLKSGRPVRRKKIQPPSRPRKHKA
jgi:metal-responsive CopG/Arc/MetJ family transcriptional regulator